MINKMKRMNRALLELMTGILLYAVIGQAAGALFAKDILEFGIGWWAGIITALFWAWHMWFTLDRALDFPEEDAVKKIRIAAITRYLLCILVLTLLILNDWGNPLAIFFGVLMLKVSAYTQPLTHKLYNRIFHEQDPVAQPLPEEEN